MASMRPQRWQTYLYRRKRRTYRERYYYLINKSTIGTHSRRDTGCRPLLYREDRIERASIDDEKQRTLGNGKADADVCTCLQSQRRLKPGPHNIREEYKSLRC